MLEHGALLLLCARRQFFFLSSNYTFFLCFCFISSVFLQHLQRLVDSLVLLLLSPFYETLHAWEAAAGPALLGIGERSCNTKQLGGLCSTQQGGVSPLSSRLTHLLPVYVSSQFAAPLCRFFFFFSLRLPRVAKRRQGDVVVGEEGGEIWRDTGFLFLSPLFSHHVVLLFSHFS